MQNKIFIGIDPGLKGCTSVVIKQEKGKIIKTFPYPSKLLTKGQTTEDNYKTVMDYFNSIYNFIGAIISFKEDTKMFPIDVMTISLEKVHAMPGQGVSSMFTFGTHYGISNILCFLLKRELDNVCKKIILYNPSPKEWQTKAYKDLVFPDTVNSSKAKSLYAIRQKHPEATNLVLGSKGGYKDGVGDSILIAYYGEKNGNRISSNKD